VVGIKNAEGYSIILGIDANEQLTDDGQYKSLQYQLDKPIQPQGHNGSLSILSRIRGLVDPLTMLHPDSLRLATYSRGMKHIDYILISASLMTAVERAGILPYNTIFSCDHRPCFLDLNGPTMFNDITHSIAPPMYRGLNSYDLRIVKRYTDSILSQIQYHKLEEKRNKFSTAAESNSWTDAHTHKHTTRWTRR
jgi:hypothetical protein